MAPARTRFTASISWMFPGLAPEDAYARARGMGFDGVEHSFPYELGYQRVIDLLQANSLEMTLIYSPCRYQEGERGFACIPGRESEYEDSVGVALDYCVKIGCRTLGTLVGQISPGSDRLKCRDTLTRNLRFAADRAEKLGIGLTVEPICSRRIPDFAIHTMSAAAVLLAEIDRANVSLCFDTYHVSMESGKVLETFDEYRKHIGYFQVANVPDRKGPGRGELDLAYIVRHVLTRGWTSWISCEYGLSPADESNGALAWVDTILDSA